MPLSRDEAQTLQTTSGKGFGRASPERNAIIESLSDGNYKTPEEIANETNIDAKVVKTRCTVMVRDKITDRRYNDVGQIYFGLTDKGLNRAGNTTEKTKSKKKKK